MSTPLIQMLEPPLTERSFFLNLPQLRVKKNLSSWLQTLGKPSFCLGVTLLFILAITLKTNCTLKNRPAEILGIITKQKTEKWMWCSKSGGPNTTSLLQKFVYSLDYISDGCGAPARKVQQEFFMPSVQEVKGSNPTILFFLLNLKGESQNIAQSWVQKAI